MYHWITLHAKQQQANYICLIWSIRVFFTFFKFTFHNNYRFSQASSIVLQTQLWVLKCFMKRKWIHENAWSDIKLDSWWTYDDDDSLKVPIYEWYACLGKNKLFINSSSDSPTKKNPRITSIFFCHMKHYWYDTWLDYLKR